MEDIKSREDIEFLIQTFYSKALKDKTIGHFFNEVVSLDLESHLPKMYDFWEMVLFDSSEYKGNPMKVHQDLNTKSAMNKTHFDVWISLFNETVDANFSGVKANHAKTRALSMATMIQIKTFNQNKG
ncbi:group III truncated hemoglobin [Salibacteraceae bacterium]|jgi:hemoglobin|nr:group III truncated hemoglobin [Salibacteraceae bacterium]MDB9708631.1 group III truncated hemoglobin [Salibacteraceae bacterium]MDC1304432.1 group III truncated hemoglobin [Salibacteraceae bacterium]